MAQKAGRIITFYSYKGGTGRTMALSNVAWILASNGYDVLLIDWDLEAPGLHRYLRPFLIDPELASTPGLIDFVWDAAQVSMTPREGDGQSIPPQFPSLIDYAVSLDWDFHGPGSIDFIPAGRQDENYAQRVNTFNWDSFYERLGGGKLLHAERERLRESYDYVLIDSRTGVSDTSSICTVQMPDVLALFFTLNRQSINGAAAVALSVTAAVLAQRKQALPVYPVPTRIENAETDKLDSAIRYSRRVFAPFLTHVQANRQVPDLDQQASYWKDVETPYVPFYAYEEVPAAFKDEPGSRRGVLAPNERIAYWITDRVVSTMRRQGEEDDRKRVVDAYSFKRETLEIERKLPARRNRLFDFVGRIRWQLVRRPWQCAGVLLALALFLITILLYQTEINLLRATEINLLRAKDARDQLDSVLIDLRNTNTPYSGEIANRLQKIRSQLNADKSP